MTVLDKIRWALGLAIVFLLILLTGRSNVHNSKKIQAANEALYTDRLLVKGQIFELSNILHEKELALARGDRAYFTTSSDAANERARALIEDFRKTYLVPSEAQTLDRFAKRFTALTQREDELDPSAPAWGAGEHAERVGAHIDDMQVDLSELARIQLDEGRREMEKGSEAVEKMDLFATVEAYLLAGIGAALMLVILAIPKRSTA